MKILIITIISYFIGNISPAILVGKLCGVDIRKEGSGNPGTTNVIRVLGLKWGILTLIIDVFKGFAAVQIGAYFGGQTGTIMAFTAVVLGHCYPILHEFSGGKGVATTLGCALAISWQAALIAFAVAILSLLITRIMSIGSLIACIAFPILLYFYRPEFIPFSILLAVFILIKHKENIGRIIKGEEKKLKFKNKGN